MSSLNRTNRNRLTVGYLELTEQKSKMPVANTATAEADGSPFRLNERDVEVLSQSEGFAILREHLAEHYEDKCVSSL